MEPIIGKTGDGWLRVAELAGWEASAVMVRVEILDGRARVTALHVDGPDAITGLRLKTLPLERLAALAMRHGNRGPDSENYARLLAKIAAEPAVPHDPRATVTVDQVAKVWTTASEEGAPPRAAVTKALHISDRTADRYIAQARELGLIPARKSGR